MAITVEFTDEAAVRDALAKVFSTTAAGVDVAAARMLAGMAHNALQNEAEQAALAAIHVPEFTLVVTPDTGETFTSEGR